LGADMALALLEELLYLIGAFVGFSVAHVGYRGYKETTSPTLLRLTIAFTLLGSGFTISGLSGLAELQMLPSIALLFSLLIIFATLLETLGYFFLAFSHMIDVRASMKIGIGSALILPTVSIPAVMKSLSLYFLLYGVAETVISYSKLKKRETLLISLGLAVIALGEFIRIAGYFYPGMNAIVSASLALKIAGLFTLYLPVARFSFTGSVK